MTRERKVIIDSLIKVFQFDKKIAECVSCLQSWKKLFTKKFCIVSIYGDVNSYESPKDLNHGIASMIESMGENDIAYVIINGRAYLLNELKDSSVGTLLRLSEPNEFKEAKAIVDKSPASLEKFADQDITDDVDDDDSIDCSGMDDIYMYAQEMEWIVNEWGIDESIAELVVKNKQTEALNDYMIITSDGIVESAIDEDELKEKILECMYLNGISDIAYTFVDGENVNIDIDISFDPDDSLEDDDAEEDDEKKDMITAHHTFHSPSIPDQVGYDPVKDQTLFDHEGFPYY